MKIKRGDSEIGDIKEEAVQDLLNAGFLLPSDMFWEESAKAWKPLSGFDFNSNLVKYKKVVGEASKIAKMAKDFSVFAYRDIKEKAEKYHNKLKPRIDAAKVEASAEMGRLGDVAETVGKSVQDKYYVAKQKMVEDYLPQVVEIINVKVLPGMKITAKTALENEVVCREVIRKTYKFLPPVITGIVSYHLFETVLLSQRSALMAKLKD